MAREPVLRIYVQYKKSNGNDKRTYLYYEIPPKMNVEQYIRKQFIHITVIRTVTIHSLTSFTQLGASDCLFVGKKSGARMKTLYLCHQKKLLLAEGQQEM